MSSSSDTPRKSSSTSQNKLSSTSRSSSTSSSDESTSSSSLNLLNNEKVKEAKKKVFLLLRPVHAFFRSDPDEYKTWKMFLGFPAGCLLGYALYLLVLAPMSLAEDSRHLLGTMLVFGLGSGFALAVSVRCVCILMIPTFMGKAGRSYIGAFAIAFLIAGPIENMVNNAQDITRSLTCAAQLAANHTAAKWKLRMDPLSSVLKDMQREGFLLSKIGKKVNKSFRPLRVEILGEEEVAAMEQRTREMDAMQDSDVDRMAAVDRDTAIKPTDSDSTQLFKKYKKKTELRCEDVYNAGMEKCRYMFSRVYHKCMDRVPWIIDDIVCPIVNFGYVCDVLSFVGKALGLECSGDQVVKESFGKSYQTTDETLKELDKGFNVELQYKVIRTKEEIDYTSVEEMRSSTMHEFELGRKWVQFVLVILKRLLGFTFLLVVFGAYKYYRSYTGDIRFDNLYITSYFRKIDARRKVLEKRVLLPLKKMEADACIYTSSVKLTKGERQKLGKGTYILLARAALAAMVFFLDNILYSVMDIIRTHSRVDYRQTGVNQINIDVEGTGVMSNIVRLFIKSLSGRTVLDQVSSNLECLPRPSRVAKRYFAYVFGIYLLIWILILFDAYALRLRRVIAGFFYRRREKMRVLHLYNTMLTKRKFFITYMRRKVKRKAKKLQLTESSSLLYSLRRQFPGLCACLGIFTSAKKRCLICDDVENKDFKPCSSPNCPYFYCKECWFDLTGECYACMPLDEFSTTSSSDLSDTDTDF